MFQLELGNGMYIKSSGAAVRLFFYDLYHRVNGPAVEYTNGDKFWWLNGKRHREDGPALDAYGRRDWFLNGLHHREDGPAIELDSGARFWYLNGKEATEEEVMNVRVKAYRQE